MVAAATILAPSAPTAELPQEYIVVLKSSYKGSAATVAAQRAHAVNGRPSLVFEHALKGFVLRLPPSLAERLPLLDPRVAYVERNGRVEASTTQSPATWGLDRIDQRALPLSNSFGYAATGAGVTAYIIDTGIRYSHAEFGGRAVFGFDTFGGTGADCNGHGTHVAGTLGGSTYGVARAVNLVAVRVLDCAGSGTNAGVIAGVDWVTGHHVSGARAVANMSLGGGASTALDTAVANSIADGVTYAVAAGNGNIWGFAVNACNSSPASPPRSRSARPIRPTGKRPGRTTAAASTGSHRESRSPRHGRRATWRRIRSAARRWRLRGDDERHRHFVEHGEQPHALHRRRCGRRSAASSDLRLLERPRR